MPVVELTKALISCPSVTPKEAGCHAIIGDLLTSAGFKIEALPFAGVENLWARRGVEEPLVVFAGHTDVVPPGPDAEWESLPFNPTIRDGYLYGRGATDMKSGLAAMLIAAQEFVKAHPQHSGSIAFLITSDEEGPSIHGTKKVMEVLTARHEKLTYCIVGEASSEHHLGDQIRVGRRGSFHGTLKVFGVQAHIAYPVAGQNPIHQALLALQELTTTRWDEGNAFFPPTTFQISNIHAGTGAFNVTPGLLEVNFNFRFGTALTPEALQKRVQQILENHGLDFALTWSLSGLPFLTQGGKLIEASCAVLEKLTGAKPTLSTAGGTSDGRFIAPSGCEVIELGPLHASQHQVNERIAVKDLEALPQIYQAILEKLLLTQG